MAKFKEQMRSQVADSMRDRVLGGQSAGGAGGRSGLERQGDGRRRLDAACAIRLDRIIPDPAQPRKEFDEESLVRLSESLKTRGQLQPIRVRWDNTADRYVVVVGERRYRAAIKAGMEAIACVVVSGNPSADDLLEDQLVENALREDLKPIEQASAYQALLAARGLSQRQLAERLQIGHASIARALALLGLPEPIQEAVDQGKIAPNTAYELTKVSDPGEQAALARDAADGQLKRDEIQRLTRSPRKGRGGNTKGKARKMTSRVVRTSAGRVTVELKRGDGLEAILAATEEAVGQLRTELGAARGEAA
jgi:ParB family transcriptional regulator, chromosome partitioning protein